MTMAGTVLVSGGSGYIAGFLIRQLLDRGWTVHTTVRDLARERELRPQLGGTSNTLKFFAADLNHDAGWLEASTGCSHVAHVASPFPQSKPKHEDDLIVPAREGALRALRAARAAGVTRFVQTSSVAAIAYGRPKGVHTFTEADWTILDGAEDIAAYTKSKTIAERAARDWVAAEGAGLEFVSVNPAAVLGPVVSADFSTSIQLVKQLLAGALPGCPDFGFGIVDVRDVADLHVRALEAPDMAGERFVCSGPFLKLIEVATILKDELGPEAHKVPLHKLPDWLLKILANFNPQVKQVVGELGNVRNADSTHAKDVLGWVPRDPRSSIIDTARSLIDQGLVKI